MSRLWLKTEDQIKRSPDSRQKDLCKILREGERKRGREGERRREKERERREKGERRREKESVWVWPKVIP